MMVVFHWDRLFLERGIKMCLGIPLKVVKLKENDLAFVSMGESYLEISTVLHLK